ncbi:MAG: hypothetical protein ACREHD_04690, partial [Pirellulales bacterium]
MTFFGHVKNGVVVFDQPVALAEGTSVCIEPVQADAERFRQLADAWKSETKHYSRSDHIAAHPAYRAIVAMGEPVVPLILRDLQESGAAWFQALREITRENPVAAESRGNLREVISEW